MNDHDHNAPREDFRSRQERANRARTMFGDETAEEIMTLGGGRFMLEAELGRGGQGSVCRAFDRHLERTVAIKQLLAADPSEAAKLLDEAKNLAQCTHENLVQVYEAYDDETDGPLMVMELVAGESLEDWLKADERPWAAIVEIFIKVGHGLIALHALDIVHRDIKPVNVLIGSDGRVKLADLGIAVRPSRAPTLPDSDGTEPRLVGTLHYMAPEHMRGAVPTARGDQYSFCVTLHEALYGERPPLRGGISKARAPCPRRITRTLERGLRQDPAERFESMVELVAVLQGVLRRRRLSGPVAVGTFLLGGAIAWAATPTGPSLCDRESTAQEFWAGASRDNVRQAFLALESSGSSFTVVDAVLTAYANELDQAHERACTGLRDDSLDRASAHATLGCLASAQDMLVGVVGQLELVSQEELVEAPERLWRTLPALASCDEAPLEIEVCSAGHPVPAELSDQAQQIEQRLRGARTSFIRGRYDEGLVLMTEALALAKPQALAPLRARVLLAQGRLLYQRDELQPAIDALERAQSLAEQNACDSVAAEALTLMAKVSALEGTSDPKKGLQWGQQAVDKLDRIGESGLLRADALNSLGLVLHHRFNRYADADVSYQGAADLRRRNDDRLETPMDLSDTLLNRGAVLAKLGRREDAVAVLEEALAVRSVALGPDHPSLHKIYLNLGNRHREGRDFQAAEQAYRRALDLAVAGLGPDHPTVARLHQAMVAALEPQHRFDEAIEHAKEAVEITQGLDDAFDLRRAHALGTLGQIYLSAARPAEARSPLTEASRVIDGNPHSTNDEKGIAAIRVGSAELAANEPKLALEWLDGALRWLETPTPGAEQPAEVGQWLAEAQMQRGEALLMLEQLPAAVATLEECVRHWEETGTNEERVARSRWGLARALLLAEGATTRGATRDRALELVDLARGYFQARPGGDAWSAEIDTWLEKHGIDQESNHD